MAALDSQNTLLGETTCGSLLQQLQVNLVEFVSYHRGIVVMFEFSCLRVYVVC